MVIHTKPAPFMKELTDLVDKDIGRTHINILNNLIEDTPKLTGHAASNWIASVGTPYTGVVGSPKNVNRTYQSASRARLGRYRSKSGDIYISNNVDYIDKLNAGYSRKARPGFVEAAIAKGLAEAPKGSKK